MEHNRTQWDTLKYNWTQYDKMGQSMIQWDIIGHNWTQYDTMGHTTIQWDILRHNGTLLNTLRHHNGTQLMGHKTTYGTQYYTIWQNRTQ